MKDQTDASSKLASEPKASPFHKGEQAIQSRLGIREKMERFGSRVIRDFMPEQHREFYNELPFILVGHADNKGWPWASILYNSPGFIRADTNQTLSLNTQPIIGDPLAGSLQKGLRLGLLGIELPTRRRNRLTAHVSKHFTQNNDTAIELNIDQAFGNCPQYIQTRELEMLDPGTLPSPKVTDITVFDAEAQKLIANSDTFFVASYTGNPLNQVCGEESYQENHQSNNHSNQGADVSHRGGQPGFIRMDNESTLTIPDYLGNNHFNTFGNFETNNKAGLLFIDFENGHILTVTGTVELLWDSPETKYFEGAERLWKFHISHGRWIHHGLPLRWKLEDYSPNSLLTGTWAEAEKLEQAETDKNSWLPYTVTKMVKESSVIKSFYLQAQDHQAAKFLPGQFLTVKANLAGKDVIRNYSLSSAPDDDVYRISVKREMKNTPTHADGIFSNYLHQDIKVGDTLFAKAPRGDFSFDASEDRPAVLLAGGVGITPMISMARHAFHESIRTRSGRSLTFIGAAKNQHQRAFFDEFKQLENTSSGQIKAFWTLGEIDNSLKPGKDYHHTGRLSAEFLKAVLPLDNYDFYLCGPSGFMQASYDLLRKLGVSDNRVYAEEFGPASLNRDTDSGSEVFTPLPVATEAIIEFADSKVEQAWSDSDGNLLDFAEAHGFSPEYGCRSGQCGACATKLISGKVAYLSEPSSSIADDEILLCCAVPAAPKDQDEALVKLRIDL